MVQIKNVKNYLFRETDSPAANAAQPMECVLQATEGSSPRGLLKIRNQIFSYRKASVVPLVSLEPILLGQICVDLGRWIESGKGNRILEELLPLSCAFLPFGTHPNSAFLPAQNLLRSFSLPSTHPITYSLASVDDHPMNKQYYILSYLNAHGKGLTFNNLVCSVCSTCCHSQCC